MTWPLVSLAIVTLVAALLAFGYVVGICSRRGLVEQRGRRRLSLSQARTVAWLGMGLATSAAIAATVDSNRQADAKFRHAIYLNCAGNNVLREILRGLISDNAARPSSRPLSPQEARVRAAIVADYLERLHDVTCVRIVKH